MADEEEAGEIDRAEIMARRQRFVAQAIAGLETKRGAVRTVALVASSLSLAACPAPQVCLNMPGPESSEGEFETGDTGNTPNPTASTTEDETGGTETGGTETGGTETGGTETGGTETSGT